MTAPATATATGWPPRSWTGAPTPADALIRLYHERREHEITYLALRHTLLKGRVLRSGDPEGVKQEMRALLTLYQALRIAVTDAVQTDRKSTRLNSSHAN